MTPVHQDKIILRVKDWVILIVGILGLLGYFGKWFRIEDKVNAHEIAISEISREHQRFQNFMVSQDSLNKTLKAYLKAQGFPVE